MAYWTAEAASGHPQTVVTRNARPLLARFAGATAFQVELHLYGKSLSVATFPIPNHDVLARFLEECQ